MEINIVKSIASKIESDLAAGKTESFCKLLDIVDLEKGKRAQLGEIREWKGKKFQKTGQGWVPVKAGGRGKEKEEPLTIAEKTEVNKVKDLFATSDSKAKDLSKMKLSRTPRGNWAASYDGKSIGTFDSSTISEKTARKAGLIEEDESEVKAEEVERKSESEKSSREKNKKEIKATLNKASDDFLSKLESTPGFESYWKGEGYDNAFDFGDWRFSPGEAKSGKLRINLGPEYEKTAKANYEAAGKLVSEMKDSFKKKYGVKIDTDLGNVSRGVGDYMITFSFNLRNAK